MLSADELLAGAALTYEVEVAPEVLHPGAAAAATSSSTGHSSTVRLRPLSLRDLQLISRAAKENDQLMATLMVQRALVEPELSAAQVAGLQVGLVQHLLDEVHRISGLAATARELDGAAEEPLAKAAFLLAREYGWTPQEVGELTLGQVLLHLRMLTGTAET